MLLLLGWERVTANRQFPSTVVAHRNCFSLHCNNFNFARCTACGRRAQGTHQTWMNSPETAQVRNDAETGAQGFVLPSLSGSTPTPPPGTGTTARSSVLVRRGTASSGQSRHVAVHGTPQHRSPFFSGSGHPKYAILSLCQVTSRR